MRDTPLSIRRPGRLRPAAATLAIIAVTAPAASAAEVSAADGRQAVPEVVESLGQAGNWSHWRGPTGNGTAPDATPPVEFDGTTGRNVRWKVEIPGRGTSSPIVHGNAVFVTTAVPRGDSAGAADDEGEAGAETPTAGPGGRRASPGGRSIRPGGPLDFQLLCYDRETGRLRWARTAVTSVPHEGTHSTNGFASHSPCTDGTHVYAHFGSRGLHCYTVDGTHVWSRDFGRMAIRNGFGEGSSPTLAGELILVPWDHEGPSKLYALDARTGSTVWEADRDEPTCWATPLVATAADGTLQVVMNGDNAARGYDLATGRELWRCGGQAQRPCGSAVAAGGVAYVASGHRGAFIGAFDLAGRGDLAGGPHVRWTASRDTPDVASPLLSGDRLYYFKERSGVLSCVDAATGRPHFATVRVPGIALPYASPVSAGGHVYLTDRGGTIVVIDDAPELRIVATNEMGEGVDATPAPAGGDLFIRGEKHLFRVAADGP
jgi:outer membrane protein assembly factor BamB